MSKSFVPTLISALALSAMLLLSSHALAAGTRRPAIGTPIGNVLETDIAARINGYPIASYNIDNWTAVIAEDLQDYGFDVTWNATQRTLTVNANSAKTLTPHQVVPKTDARIGRKVGSVLSTDIVTYVGGVPVRSFNLGGKTAIVIDDLGRFGAVTWSPKQRTITASTRASAMQNVPGYVRWEEVPVQTEMPGKFIVASDGFYFRAVTANPDSRRQSDFEALYFSPDGVKWEKTASAATHPRLLEVLGAAGDAGHSVLYGLQGEFDYTVNKVSLVRSQDRGRTWRIMGDFSLLATALWPTRAPGHGQLEFAGSTTNPDNILVSWWGGGAGHLSYSTNGGANWKDSSGISVPYLPIHIGSLQGGSFWAQGVSPLCISNDEGANFIAVAEKWTNKPGEELMNAPLRLGAETDLLYQMGREPMLSQDRGGTWKPMHIPSWSKADSFLLTDVSADRPGLVLGNVVENVGGALYRLVFSPDAGVSWVTLATDFGEFTAPPIASFAPEGRILLVTNNKAYVGVGPVGDLLRAQDEVEYQINVEANCSSN